MNFNVIYAITFVSVISLVNCSPNNRVIGGIDAKDLAHPHQVSLQRGLFVSSHFCGGSIISKDFVVTAAHCVDNRNASEITILAGTSSLSNLGDYGVYRDSAEIYKHPIYNYSVMEADIALIRLASPLTFSPAILPIRLAETDAHEPDQVVLTGWGYVNLTTWKIPDRLQELTLPTLDWVVCAEIMVENRATWKITESNVCTLHDQLNRGACNGDSGGPISRDGQELVGVVSWGFPCAIGKPDAYARISSFREWIRDISGV